MPRALLFKPEFVEKAKKIAALGATDAEIADVLDVSLRTFMGWKVRFPELDRAVRLGKAAPDARVERSLYQRAVGYTAPETVLHQMPDRVGKDGRTIKGRTVLTEVLRHYPPDSVACMFWLKNRKRGEWYDIKAVELGNLGGNSFRVALLPEDGQAL